MTMDGGIHFGVARTIASVTLLAGLAHEDGFSISDVLAGTGISTTDLHSPDTEIRGAQELLVVGNLLRLGVGPSFAFRAGMRYRISAYGMLGYALLNCETSGDAIRLCERFINLSFAWCNLVVTESGSGVTVTFDASALPPEMRAFAVERDMAALAMVSRDLTGGRLPLQRLCMAHGRLAPLALYSEVIRGVPEFGQASNCWEFDRAQLDTRLPLANPLTWQQCVRACEELLEQRKLLVGLTGTIRGYLMRNADRMPSMEEVAEFLHMTPRTLRRHLLKEEASFRDIVHSVRRGLAESMLVDGRVPLHEIAARLGYQDTNSFLTAFRLWTGVTPATFRRERGRPT